MIKTSWVLHSAVMAPKDRSISGGWSTYCNLDLHDLSSELESSWVCSFTDAHTHQLEYTSIVLDQLWLAYVPSFLFFNDKKWSHIKFSFSTSGKSCIMKHWGVCPLHTKGSSDGDYSNGVKTSNDNDIDDDSNPGGSVLDDLREWGLEDTIIRRSLEEGRPRGHAYEDVNGSVLPDTIMRSFHEANSQAWKQDRIQMQLNPPISTLELIFGFSSLYLIFLFLARISYSAP